ncbi:MAG: glycosyltransferase family 4 protein [Acidobacteria bacterium]|nr:glycosyltransferase family 4 protein [Acidobacteriota bacterium]
MARAIGIDARELLGATTGVGRYLGELLSRWTTRPDAGTRQLVLYAPEPLPVEVAAGADVRVIPGGRGTSWEQLALRTAVNRDAPEIFFAPAYTAPLGLRMPYAVTIHDVSFSARPDWFRRREGIRRRWLTRRAARMAQRVFTDSEFSRAELEKHYSLPAFRIEVIYPGFTPRPHPPAPRERIVLFAGSLFNRRRLPDLIAAFAVASRGIRTARLIIVGEDRTWPPQDLPSLAAAHGVSGRTELRSYISDEELASLYGRAAVFAFLSEYEGFGLTPLEALAAGTPTIVLDTAVAREVYGDAVTYVASGDIDGTAKAIAARLAAPGSPDPHMKNAASVLGRYSWDTAADRTLASLESITRP